MAFLGEEEILTPPFGMTNPSGLVLCNFHRWVGFFHLILGIFIHSKLCRMSFSHLQLRFAVKRIGTSANKAPKWWFSGLLERKPITSNKPKYSEHIYFLLEFTKGSFTKILGIPTDVSAGWVSRCCLVVFPFSKNLTDSPDLDLAQITNLLIASFNVCFKLGHLSYAKTTIP